MGHGEWDETRAWVLDAIGEPLLRYLLPDVSAAGEAGANATVAPGFFSAAESLRGQIPDDFDQQAQNRVLRNWLLQKAEDGRTIARLIREQSFADEVQKFEDAIRAALIEVALNVYPALLIPPEPLPFPVSMPREVDSIFSVAAYQNGVKFSDAVLKDEHLGRALNAENEALRGQLNYQANTGHGGSLQVPILLSDLLLSAWRDVRETAGPVTEYVNRVIIRWGMTRKAILGQPVEAIAKVAFTGILLPEGDGFEFGAGTVRAVTSTERERAPESLKGKISGTSADGEDVTVNYDGDVLLEYAFPYRLRLHSNPDAPWVDSDDMRPPVDLNRLILKLRFALMLTVDRIPRAQLIPTWTTFDEPLGSGFSMSWSDPKQMPGFAPVRLTPEDVERWIEWFNLLNDPRVDKIELALSRTLRALAERRDPADVLVDSVIAWENLFGTKDGEPTFRITMCLTKLLKQDLSERVAFRTDLGKIYALRSKVVHGSGELKPAEMAKCQEALEVAISAIRALISQRQEILDLKDGALRSAWLLLDD